MSEDVTSEPRASCVVRGGMAQKDLGTECQRGGADHSGVYGEWVPWGQNGSGDTSRKRSWRSRWESLVAVVEKQKEQGQEYLGSGPSRSLGTGGVWGMSDRLDGGAMQWGEECILPSSALPVTEPVCSGSSSHPLLVKTPTLLFLKIS